MDSGNISFVLKMDLCLFPENNSYFYTMLFWVKYALENWG